MRGSERQEAVNRILEPLAAGFRLGVALRHAAYRRGWLKTRRLNRPVVSVGNLTVGGTGKTPLVAWIAERLLRRGWSPGILTRGYGRRRGTEVISIEPGANRTADPREVGDEAALLARALPKVPIVICGDRFRAGRLAEERFHVDVHLLDDGFQHLALERDVDVLVIDSTQELSDRALLPAGRLREPCSALQRAHLVVLTRVDLGDPVPLENRVTQINPQARIFRSTTRLCGLRDVASGGSYPLESFRGKAVSVFCGIGNPQAFFSYVQTWGFSILTESVFPDHHVYSRADLDHLGALARKAAAAALLTTEKDAMNLTHAGPREIPVLTCVIETEICEAEAFEQALFSRLGAVRVRV